ncbi:DNA topoisomerase 3-beta isoform X1 [Tanacetum coccineum]
MILKNVNNNVGELVGPPPEVPAPIASSSISFPDNSNVHDEGIERVKGREKVEGQENSTMDQIPVIMSTISSCRRMQSSILARMSLRRGSTEVHEFDGTFLGYRVQYKVTSVIDHVLRCETYEIRDKKGLIMHSIIGHRFITNKSSFSSKEKVEGLKNSRMDQNTTHSIAGDVAANDLDTFFVVMIVMMRIGKLELYGCYKIATKGPYTAPQPSALKVTARTRIIIRHIERVSQF